MNTENIAVGDVVVVSVWNGSDFTDVTGPIEAIEIDDNDQDLRVIILANDSDNVYSETQITEIHDRCAVCDIDIDETINDDTTAHHASAWNMAIVAWTCSAACSDAYESDRRITVG